MSLNGDRPLPVCRQFMTHAVSQGDDGFPSQKIYAMKKSAGFTAAYTSR